MKGNLYTLAYAAVMGTVCALLLTGAGMLTAPYREANAKAEEVRNILAVLEVPFNSRSSSNELLGVFEENVRKEEFGELEAYVFETQGQVQAVAIPFFGPGLWGPIEGFLSLESDMQTIRSVTFYKQEETPGLGGEIASDGFRSQFRGKSMVSPNGKVGIRITRGGGASGPSEVDGISGATMTCEKVEAMLNKAIVRIVKERGRDG